ncbi:peptidylprolyl isomerase [Pannonibacter phragmitetus]|uniref:foldase protein PrsA n=1 Tax=Stappiaceae TaxID=2821832 RepID=UPI00067C4289|nr:MULTISPECIES: peptidylprolyl isomerase [Stappiaceae]MAW89469.1 peptidylprolyl isomerase [Phyllobacteriaceae bacterium]KND16529.1 peptidylprolyl isomerase [Pannonibacter phragmitetus]MAA98424.1 peptidylprolyl isomerase [Stappia sp.]MBM19160.1 peptidylprolyl isomerase [Stappia sp.]MBM20232.1 peptidylprolyl isomerase [Stappia sp.]|tara:strand:- start:2459 stop:3325 length:867 start_codon:yes stop_codon:yes gene_type:complete
MTILSSTPSKSLRRLALALLMATASGSAFAQSDEVVARVNGSDITRADVAVAEEMYSPQLGTMPADARLSVIVDTLIEMKIISDAAKSAGIEDRDDYKRQLQFFEQQTLRAIFMEQKAAKAVTDDAIRQIYDRQVGSMPVVSERRLRHILVASEDEAKDIITALGKGGSFAELAAERSLDAVSKVNGGDLGFVAEGQTIPEVDKAARGLEAGDYTKEPVRSAFGFHVIQLEESRDRPPPAFELVEPQIRQSLTAAEERRISGELRATASVEKLVPDVAPPQEDDGHDH